MEVSHKNITVTDIRNILEIVVDPELPVLTIGDLSIVRDVKYIDGIFEIYITPTYSGCPAMDMISMNIRMAMMENGINNFKIIQQLSPAWTTDWMSDEGKEKLKEYGIAPPIGKNITEDLEKQKVPCPQCNSLNTEMVSQFGSTACKALFRCLDCREPFDYFKCH